MITVGAGGGRSPGADPYNGEHVFSSFQPKSELPVPFLSPREVLSVGLDLWTTVQSVGVAALPKHLK